jgi:transposase
LSLCRVFVLRHSGWMARAYSDDLRRKLLEAHAAGKGTLPVRAERFGVSLAWAWKISAARKRSGTTARPPQRRHGVPSRIDRGKIASLLRARPDLLLRELQAELQARTGVGVSTPHLWKIVGELGFLLKKVAPRHRTRHRREPQTARSLRRTAAQHRAGTVDLPGRKRRFDADDQALRTRTWAASGSANRPLRATGRSSPSWGR